MKLLLENLLLLLLLLLCINGTFVLISTHDFSCIYCYLTNDL